MIMTTETVMRQILIILRFYKNFFRLLSDPPIASDFMRKFSSSDYKARDNPMIWMAHSVTKSDENSILISKLFGFFITAKAMIKDTSAMKAAK